MRNAILLVCIICVFSCEKEENYEPYNSFYIESKFDFIRSCPGGGGLFILKINNTGKSIEKVNIQLDCSDKLNAELSQNEIYIEQPVFEILIKPDNDISISDFDIIVIGERRDYIDSTKLNVSIIEWDSATELDELANAKKTLYMYWLNNNYPGISINNQTEWYIYTTYPQIIIVQDFTLLNDHYEMRICNHATIPPHDWSMIRLRERKKYEPFLAAKQDSTGGIIYSIPVNEYPIHDY